MMNNMLQSIPTDSDLEEVFHFRHQRYQVTRGSASGLASALCHFVTDPSQAGPSPARRSLIQAARQRPDSRHEPNPRAQPSNPNPDPNFRSQSPDPSR